MKKSRKRPSVPVLDAYLCTRSQLCLGEETFSHASNFHAHQALCIFFCPFTILCISYDKFEVWLSCMNDTVSIILFHMQRRFVLISWGMSQLLF